ncbi:MAG: hybrid sensor histidine kinase/response regulator [Bacteroidales bacterium]
MKTEENPKILIIDDIASNIQVVANLLKKNNYNISYAQSGKAGIERAQQANFDLILLDIMMPEMDGYEVCLQLKKDIKTKDIPIIFLTAKTTEESLKRGFESGAVDFITKPFKADELLARVATHIQLKIVREILSETNLNLQKANQDKDKLLSIIAHDLSNPFSVLITFSKLLIDSYDDFSKDDIMNYLKTFYQTSKQGYNLLDNLLKWSKSQTGKLDAEPINLDMKDLVEENITLLLSQAKSKKIILVNHVPEDLIAFADLNMILTVIRNLVSNAIKFTHENGKVEVFGHSHSNFIEIIIKDNGVGISDEDLQKIFRIDVKHSTPGTANEAGTGLGLVLCKEFIERNMGKLIARSTPGEGSEFVFLLPKPK